MSCACTLSEQLATELARTTRSQQQSREEEDDVIYNLWYMLAGALQVLHLQVPWEGPFWQQTFLRRTLKFGIKRHLEGLFQRDPAARANHWPRVLQNWRNHPMIMTWRNCVWDQLNLKMICVLKRRNLVSPLYYSHWHKTSKAWFMPSFLFKISTSYGLVAGSFMM
jgi:hypothetical protein